MASATPAKRVLVVDDDMGCLDVTRWFLNHYGYEVQIATNSHEALALFDPRRHCLVITDNSMPGMSGFEMAREIKRISPGTPIVMHSGGHPPDQSCLDGLIEKPANMTELCQLVAKLVALKDVQGTAGELSA